MTEDSEEETEYQTGVGTCCEYCDWQFLNQYKTLEQKIETLKAAILETSIIVAAGHGNPKGDKSGGVGVASETALRDMEDELFHLEAQLELQAHTTEKEARRYKIRALMLYIEASAEDRPALADHMRAVAGACERLSIKYQNIADAMNELSPSATVGHPDQPDACTDAALPNLIDIARSI